MVIVNPAGTRSAPSTRVISATPAPLPPSSSRCSREPSENSRIHLIACRPRTARRLARASSGSARLRLASSIISPSSSAAPRPAAGERVEDRLARSTTCSAVGEKARSAARPGRGAAPTCRRSRARALAPPRRAAPSASAICRYGPSIACSPAARAATSTAPRTKSHRGPSSGESKPSETLMSAGPRISASRRRRPRRSRSRRAGRAPTRSAPGGRSVARARRAADSASSAPPRSSSSARSALGTITESSRSPAAATARASSSNHGVAVAVDPHADRRRRPAARGERLGDRRPRLLLELRRDRVLEVDDDLVGHQLPAPSRASSAGEPVRERQDRRALIRREHTSSTTLLRLKRRRTRRRGRRPQGQRRWPLLRGSGAGPGLRRPRADAHLGPRGAPPGDRRRPDAAAPRRAAEPRGDRPRRRPRAPQPGLRRRHRPVDHARPSGCSATSSTAGSCSCGRCSAATPCARAPRSSP